MSTVAPRTLALAERHRALGARFAPFAGWEMPVQYAGIVEEHNSVRQRAGVFDVSHMGRLYATGSDAGVALRRVLTYKVDQLSPGEAHYAFLCDDNGGILDDVFVYRLDDSRLLVVNNAANVATGLERVRAVVQDGDAVELDDRQSETVMLAVQGPDARATVARVMGAEAALEIRPRHCAELEYAGEALFVSRTGYTGEDGFELVTTVAAGAQLLDALVAAGVAPCGLGSRDTLRLEAALPLYGNDIDTATNPWEAGLSFAVSLDDGVDFAGRGALEASKTAQLARKLSCLKATGRGVMRAGYVALHGGEAAASICSGGFSPVLGVSIGMAYLPVDLAHEGTELEVDVRGKPLPAVVVPRPFYRRKKTKAT